jgi:hypothetical protein
MKLSFDLGQEDWIHFNLFMIHHNEINKKRLKKNRWYPPLCILIIGGYVVYLSKPYDLILDVMGFCFFILLSVLWVWLYPKFQDNHIVNVIKKSADEVGKKTTFTHYEFDFTEDEIIEKTPYNETKMKWDSIYSLKEDDAYFYLLLDATKGYIIPKKACPNQEAFKKMVLSKLSNN